ncbi:hypothetical protein BJV77DRAFT_960698 [Russula vinacea]|nr:hypothetical protein BJV77DRAFT_960698 [Russula vinacea]
MALATPEMALPANFATRFTGTKTRSILERLERCLAIAAERASTRGSSDIITSVMSSGNITGGSDSDTGTRKGGRQEMETTYRIPMPSMSVEERISDWRLMEETVQRWGWLYLGKFQQLLRGMSGARLRRVGHEANIPRCQEDAGVDHNPRKDRYNESCWGRFTSSLHWPVRGNVAILGIAFKDRKCWADSTTGMNNLLSGRDKLEYKT